MKRFANQFLAGGFLLFTLPLLRGAPNQFSIQIVKDGSAVPQMSWGVQSNLLFFLEARTDFATASWGRMAVSNLQASLTNSIAWVKDVRPPGNRQFYRLRAAPISRFGAHASLGKRPDFPNYLGDLGASWARVNANLDGNDGDFRPFLDAGLNLIITFSNRDPLNVNTNYGGLAEWPKAGFPFLSKSNYEQRTREALGPLLPYLAMGQQVWVQCENEIGDAASGAGSIYWRGTTDQYLTNNLQTLSDVARSLSPAIRVVLTSFASENLDTVLTPADPNYIFQTNRMTRLLSEGLYDAADLHFYGAVSNIPPKIQWVKDRLPPGRL